DGLRTAEIADGEPTIDPGAPRAHAVSRGAGPPRPPGENHDLGAVGQTRERPLARVVRQRDARRSISPAIYLHPSTDGKDGNGYADRWGRATRTPTKSHRNLLVAA